MTWMDWYNSLVKPSWTSAPATIGLIWQILYPIILVTFGFVFVRTIRRKIRWIVVLPFERMTGRINRAKHDMT